MGLAVVRLADSSVVFAGVEIDGAWRSIDGGTLRALEDEVVGYSRIHGGAQRRASRSLLRTNAGLHVSSDDGASWTMRPIDSAWQYTRSIAERRGRDGRHVHDQRRRPTRHGRRLFHDRNHEVDWEDAGLPGEVESSAYFLATNPADPKLIYAAATLGQIYRSTDGGESWMGLKRRLGEIRALAWLPD